MSPIDESKQAERLAAMAVAARPVMRRLQTIDPTIDSIWDLVNQPIDIRPFVDILIEGLSSVDNLDVVESIARALTDRRARPRAAMPMIEAFRRIPLDGPRGGSVKWAIGNGLTMVANDSVFDPIVELLTDRRHGGSRQMLTYVVARSRRPEAPGILLDLLDDPDVAGHVVVGLVLLAPVEGRSRIAAFETDHRRWVRRAATRVVAKIDKKLAG